MKEQQGLIWNQSGSRDEGQDTQAAGHFGNYDLVRRIDVGGMGEVYLARQRTAFGREVAVKIIRSDLVHDITARKRFLREAEVSAHLKHEHILPLFEFGEEQGRLFLVTPYIEGGTLARRLRNGPLTISEVYQLFSALVKAVAYIHKRGVVHRDLKPSNILLDREEGSDQVYVRLIDFGIASLQGSVASPPLTEAGHEMGTVEYMAPERLNGIAATSNDIYSLGIILYQMLTGQLPSGGKMAALPESLEAVIHRATAIDPANRFASADELLGAFEQAYRSLSASQAATRAQSAPAPSQRPINSPVGASPSVGAPPSVGAQFTSPPPIARPAQTEPETGNQPTARRGATGENPSAPIRRPPARPGYTTRPHSVVRFHDDSMPDLPLSGRTFSRQDYDAPTTELDPASIAAITGSQKQLAVEDAVLAPQAPAPPQKKRRRSLLPLISLSIIVILLLIGVMGLMSLQTALSARVTLSPQVRTISKVITITARQGQPMADASTAAIPINTQSSTKTMSKTGPTTGRPFLCLFQCPRVVSSDDVDALGVQVKQSLMTQLSQDLKAQLQASNASEIGNPTFTDGDSSVNPPVGTPSNTVTVTLTEQGSVNYYSNSDAQSVARTLFGQQVGANYQLLDQLTRVGQPAVKGVDANGNATLAVPVAGVAKYRLSPDELQSMQVHIKGMKLNAARAFLARQPGVDAQSVAVTLSYGDTLPTNTGQITITAVDPTNVPQVQLPRV